MLKTNMLSIQNVRLQQRCHSFLVLSLKPRHSQDHQIFSSYCRGVAIRRNGELNIQKHAARSAICYYANWIERNKRNKAIG